MFGVTGIALLVDTIILVFWFVFSPLEVRIDYFQYCATTSHNGFDMEAVYHSLWTIKLLIFILYGFHLCWRIRSIPDSFAVRHFF